MERETTCPLRGLDEEPRQPLGGGICCVHGAPGCETSNGKPIDWSRRTPLHDDGCCMVPESSDGR